MNDVIEHNFDLLDGYDELPKDLQDTVRRAFEQGHVDDADWRGVGADMSILFSLLTPLGSGAESPRS